MSRYLANENFPLEAIKMLRADGADILSATESYRGIDDRSLLRESIKAERILITFDKDFGEFVFRYKTGVPCGIILLRFKPKSARHVYEIVSELLRRKFTFEGHYSVVTEKKIRMIPIEKSNFPA